MMINAKRYFFVGIASRKAGPCRRPSSILLLAGLMIQLALPASWSSRLNSTAFAKERSSSRIADSNKNASAEKRVRGAIGQLPLSFEVNQGQSHPRFKFLSRNGYNLFLTSTEAVLAIAGTPAKELQESKRQRLTHGRTA